MTEQSRPLTKCVPSPFTAFTMTAGDRARDGELLMGGRSYPHRLTIDVEPEVYEALRVHAFRERTNVAELVRRMGRRLLTEDRSLAREVRERLDGSAPRASGRSSRKA